MQSSVTAERRRRASEARERAKRQRARARGLVVIGWAERWLKTDRRQLAKLYTAAVVPGDRVDGTIALDRRALAAWAFSRPRCVVDGCDRRVLREGLGCSRHPSHGKQHSAETRQKMSDSAIRRWNGSAPLLVYHWRICEWCGHGFEQSPYEARHSPGRFCSHEHLNAYLQHGEGAEDRRSACMDGFDQWQTDREQAIRQLKAAGAIVGLDGLAATLPGGLRRSSAALAGVRGHIASGAVTTIETVELHGETRRLEELRIVAFAPEQAERYQTWIVTHGDGRLRRFNVTAPEARPFRAVWYEARHSSQAEFGRLAPMIAAASGKKAGRPSELDLEAIERIRDMAARGKSQRTIAQTLRVSRGQVRRVLGS